METQNARFVRRSTPLPLQQKCKAAFRGQPPFQRTSPRTPSSESGVPCNRIARHVQSSPSNSASVLVPVKWRNLRRAYITTHSRYHGHRLRHRYGTSHNAAQPPQGLYTFIIFSLSGPYSLEALSGSMIVGHITRRNNQGGKKLRCTREPPGGL